jgi:hypothetical protein
MRRKMSRSCYAVISMRVKFGYSCNPSLICSAGSLREEAPSTSSGNRARQEIPLEQRIRRPAKAGVRGLPLA